MTEAAYVRSQLDYLAKAGYASHTLLTACLKQLDQQARSIEQLQLEVRQLRKHPARPPGSDKNPALALPWSG